MDSVEVLLMLGSLELGQDYSKETLTPTQKHMLEDLREYGIVYSRKVRLSLFPLLPLLPTPPLTHIILNKNGINCS